MSNHVDSDRGHICFCVSQKVKPNADTFRNIITINMHRLKRFYRLCDVDALVDKLLKMYGHLELVDSHELLRHVFTLPRNIF